jgi:hypothetical protein
MTFAELSLLIVGGAGIYFLLTPIQRRLETYLFRKFFGRHPPAQRLRRPVIDVTDFTSYESRRREDHHQ